MEKKDEPDFEGIKRKLTRVLNHFFTQTVWIVVKRSEEIFAIAYLIDILCQLKHNRIDIQDDGLWEEELSFTDAVILRESYTNSYHIAERILAQRRLCQIDWDGLLIILRPYSPYEYDIFKNSNDSAKNIALIFWKP